MCKMLSAQIDSGSIIWKEMQQAAALANMGREKYFFDVPDVGRIRGDNIGTRGGCSRPPSSAAAVKEEVQM